MEAQLLILLAVVLVIVGIAGTILPAIPGPILVFAGLFLAAWAEGFQHVGVIGLSIIGLLGAAAWGADLVGTLIGAKRVGASPLALVGAALGSFGGFFFGIPGLIVGPFLGAAAGEYLARGRLGQAGKVGFGTWIGLVIAAILKVALVFLMIGTFFAAYFLGSLRG
jgi:uncharacterized protein YqgC (DUF456 family)